MHRLLVTSAVYRQSSIRTPILEKIDPENRLLGWMPLKHMEAEVLYDNLLAVSGRLDPRAFDAPDPVDVRPDGLVTSLGLRRSVYVLQRRKDVPTLLENFDFPQMTPNCIERTHTTVALQALNLMNDGLVRESADAFARRVMREAGTDPAGRIERAYWIAFSRPLTAEERGVGLRAGRIDEGMGQGRFREPSGTKCGPARLAGPTAGRPRPRHVLPRAAEFCGVRRHRLIGFRTKVQT